MNLEDNVNAEEIENPEESIALDLGESIKREIEKAREEIDKASEKISALEEMAAIQKALLSNGKKTKKEPLKKYLTGMIKTAIEKVKIPRKYEEISAISKDSVNETKYKEIKREELDLAENAIRVIYLHIPLARYSPQESINADEMKAEKENLKTRILNYFIKKENLEINAEYAEYAQRWAGDLSLALAHGREKAIITLINNIEKKAPNDIITERIGSLLSKLKEEYG